MGRADRQGSPTNMPARVMPRRPDQRPAVVTGIKDPALVRDGQREVTRSMALTGAQTITFYMKEIHTNIHIHHYCLSLMVTVSDSNSSCSIIHQFLNPEDDSRPPILQ